MENEKLKVGVIGTGALGRHHARLYAQSPNAEVVGIFDVQKETAEKVGAEFNLKVFDQWEELAEKCDALSVAVPANYHANATIPLLNMGNDFEIEFQYFVQQFMDKFRLGEHVDQRILHAKIAP